MTLEITLLPHSVGERLRASIITQIDAPGSSITEAAVAVRYGVARPTARIAIDRLVADGILRREAHRAARVPQLTRADVVDLFENRAMVEGAAAAALATSGAIPAAALAAHRSVRADDSFATHDIAFHRALVAGQASPRLVRIHSVLMGEIELCIGQVQAANLLTATDVRKQHQGILDAIVAGDPDVAARRARGHIAFAQNALLTHLDSRNVDGRKTDRATHG